MPSNLAKKLIDFFDLPSRFYQIRGDLAFKAFIIVDRSLGRVIGPVIEPLILWIDNWQQRRYERAYWAALAKIKEEENAPLVRRREECKPTGQPASSIEQTDSLLLELPREVRDGIYGFILPVQRMLLVQQYNGRLWSFLVSTALLKPLNWTQEQVAVQSLMGPPYYLLLLLTCRQV